MNKVFTIDLKSLNVNAYVSRFAARQTGNGMAVFENADELLENPNMTTNKVLDAFNKVSKKKVKRFADRKTGVKRLFTLINLLTPLTKTIWDSRGMTTDEMELYKEKVPTSGQKVSKPRGQFAGKMIRILVDKNPRKENNKEVCGYASFNLLLKHGADMPYELYIKSGGRLEDLKWDIKKGWAEVYDV
jgi:hypothetical protein|tara:strand:+ start:3484 stop:4047 length:564 start_codon:yes stop_codon:yes gene_type:complete